MTQPTYEGIGAKNLSKKSILVGSTCAFFSLERTTMECENMANRVYRIMLSNAPKRRLSSIQARHRIYKPLQFVAMNSSDVQMKLGVSDSNQTNPLVNVGENDLRTSLFQKCTNLKKKSSSNISDYQKFPNDLSSWSVGLSLEEHTPQQDYFRQLLTLLLSRPLYIIFADRS